MKKRIRKLRRRMKRLRLRARRLREGHHLRRWHRVRREITKNQRQIEKTKERNREGIDVSWGRPSPESLKAAGKDFIAMYLNDIPDFGMTARDVKRYCEGGIDIVAIYERGQEDPREGYHKGVEHARDAIREAQDVGIPSGRPIFFAVDYEAKGSEIVNYFIGIRDTMEKSRWVPGAYGSIVVIGFLFTEELIEFGFQTYAWSNHRFDNRAGLRQVLINLPENELEIGGSKVDYCRSIHVDFGQWNTITNINGPASHQGEK